MRIETLKNPGAYSGSQSLRAKVARAISFAEVISRGRETPAPTAVNLAAFLADAASKCPGYEAPTPTLPDTQVIVSDAQVITLGANTYTFTIVGGEITDIAVAPV